MKKTTLIFIIVLTACLSLFAQNSPYSVTGPIEDSSNNIPTSITWDAFITSRPSEIIDETTFGSGFDNGNGYYWMNLSNFTTQWAVGDVVQVDFEGPGNETATITATLTNAAVTIPPLTTLQPQITTHTISGYVGRTTIVDLGGTYSTDSNGNYSIIVNAGDNLTITPSLTGYDFTPPSMIWTNIQADYSNQDFTATEWTPNPPTAGTPTGTGVVIGISALGWSAPTSGVTPTKYIVTMSSHADYSLPIIDAEETVSPGYSLAAVTLGYSTTYYVKVIANYTAPTRNGINSSLRTNEKMVVLNTSMQMNSGNRGNSTALEWNFTTENIPTYTVSGYAGVAAVVDLGSGNSTNGSGNYSITVDEGDNLTLTPVLTGYDFAPSTVTLNNITSNTVQNFTATEWNPEAPIAGLPTGASVSINVAQLSWSAPASGVAPTKYFVTLADNGSYTSPLIDAEETTDLFYSLSLITLANSETYYVKIVPNYTAGARGNGPALEWDFTTASVPTYTVSGYAGVAAVVDLGSGNSTNGSGNYSITVDEGDNLTLTPVLTGYDFAPSTVTLNNITSNTVQNFTATEWNPEAPTAGLPTGTGVSVNVAQLSWSAPANGVAPTKYFVTLADNGSYTSPLIDAEETTDLFYSLSSITLVNSETYYAKIVPNYTAGARGNGPALEWNFTTASVITHTVSGYAGIAAVVDLGSGNSTDGSGNYSLTVNHGDNLTLIPVLTGYNFAPSTVTLNNITSNTVQNFTATEWNPEAPTAGLPTGTGVSVNVAQLSWSVPASGIAPTKYFVTLADNGSYTSPLIDAEETTDLFYSLSSITLANSEIYYAKIVPNYTAGARGNGPALEWNFTTAAVPTHTVSGYAGIAAVVDLGSGNSTNTSGNYSISVTEGDNLTLTPVLTGYDFAPTTITLTNVTANIVQNFVATEWNPEAPTAGLPTGSAVAIDVAQLSWSVPASGVAPTKYFVTLADNGSYTSPLIDAEETTDLFYSLTSTTLLGTTLYYAKVVPNYTAGARGNGPALEWNFTTVATANQSPIADAGADQTVNEGVLVTLDGSGSYDPDGSIATYSWTAPAGIVLSDASVVNPTFTAPDLDVYTNYTFTLEVTDNHGASNSDDVVIEVLFVNQDPIADAGADQSVNEGVLVTLDGSGSYDPDGLDTITYSWTAPAGIVLSDATVVSPTFTAPDVDADTNYTFTLEVTDNHSATAFDDVVVEVLFVNQNPIADAGADASVLGGSIVTLDGSASYDPDPLDVLTFAWTAPTGIVLSDASAEQPTFTSPIVTIDTQLTFTLEVSDGHTRAVASDDVVITVLAGNVPPVADAGIDQDVNEGVLVTLDGSASYDPDGTIATYSWVAPMGITLSDPNIASPTFTAPNLDEDASYTFTLTVDDGVTRDTDSDDVVINVMFVNQNPIADAGVDQSVDEGTFVTLDGSGSYDPDGLDTIIYNWVAPAGIILSDITAVNPTFTAPNVDADAYYTFTLEVTDNHGAAVTDDVVVEVLFVNQIPVAIAGIDQYIEEGMVVTLNGSGSSDADGLDVLTYNWIAPAGITLSDPSAINPTFTAPDVDENTDYTFTLTVSDNHGATDTDNVTVYVLFINQSPVADAGVDQFVDEGVVVTLDGSASADADGLDVLTYNWIVPAGIVLSNSAAVNPTFTTPDVDEDTDYLLTLEVSDNHGSTDTDEVTISVLFINQAPVADAGDDQVVDELLLVTLDGSGSYDPDGLDTITYNWIAPAGITLSDPTIVNPTFVAPDLNSNEVYAFTLEVSDNHARLIDSDEVLVTIEFVNHAPVADAGIDQTANEGDLVTLDGSGSYDIDAGDVLTYSWSASAGIVFSDATAINPNFTAPDVDEDLTYYITLTVSDGHARLVDSDVMELLVIFQNQAPVADAGDDITQSEGNLVLLNASGSSDPDGLDVLTYFWEAPVAITLSNPNVINPTFVAPDVDENTPFTITLTVNDGHGRAMDTDDIVVNVLFINQPPVADAGDDQIVNELNLVTLDGSASYDPDGLDVLTYSWDVPEGITLSDPSAINPTFTAPEVDEDIEFTFELTVTDNHGRSVDSDEVDILVLFDNQAPVADAGEDQVVLEGELVTLDGSASYDPDSVDELSFSWNVPAGINLDDDEIMNPTFTAPEVDEDTEFILILTVSDGHNREIDSDEVVITVMNFIYPYPVCAINPVPADNVMEVEIDAQIGWSYVHEADYSVPTEFRVLMGYDEDLTDAVEATVAYSGDGDYLVDSLIDLVHNTEYFWQVIPTTDTATRDDALDCPVWSFSSVALPEYTVSGHVGVYATVDLGDGYTTDEMGDYSITLLMGDNITITPTFYGYTFDPESVVINNIQEDIVQDFDAELACPEAPENGLPTGIDVVLELEELSWDAPSAGIDPTYYVVSLSEHSNFTNPIIQEEVTTDTYFSVAEVIFNASTTYYVQVYANYTPAGGISGCDGPALEWSFVTEDGLNGGNNTVPDITRLQGNFPNPFNPRTEIKFNVKEGEVASLTIYNIKGQQMIKKTFTGGEHTFVYDVDADATGIYFYRLRTSSYSEVRKMLMLK